MRYYAIKIDESTNPVNMNWINGLANLAGGLLGAGTSSTARQRVAPKGRRGNRSTLSAGRHSFVSAEPMATPFPLPGTIASVGSLETQNLLSTLKVPPSVQAVIGALINGAQWTSVVDGRNDPGALDIEFEITDVGNNTTGGWLKIYGVPQNVISQISQFNNREIQIYAGFSEGLPLANMQVPHQGLICDGKIFPCYGNWIGNELSIEFILQAGSLGPGNPTDSKNIIHNMPAGTPLSTAIENAFQSAFANSNVFVNISDKLVLNYPDQGFHQSIEQYANYVKALSHNILGTPETTGYQGIMVKQSGNNIYVGDGTTYANSIAIQFEDLIGQPTWSPNADGGSGFVLQVKTALRADISTITSKGQMQITLPPNTLVSTPTSTVGQAIPINSGAGASGISPNNVLNFQGTWDVIRVRHVGRFRDPKGDAWVTIIDATSQAFINQGFNAASNAINTSGKQTFGPITINQ